MEVISILTSEFALPVRLKQKKMVIVGSAKINLQIHLQIRFLFAVLFLLSSAPFNASLADSSVNACIQKASQSPLYQAEKICQQLKASKLASTVSRELAKMGKYGFCVDGFDSKINSSSELKALCADPAGYACARDKGNIFTENCQLNILNNSEASQLPSYVRIQCDGDAQAKLLISRHLNECPKSLSSIDCAKYIAAVHADEIGDIYRKAAYTPERVARVEKMFARVKAQQIELVKNSKLIPTQRKTLLIGRLENTKLGLPLDPRTADSCTVPGPDGPDTGIFNSATKNGDTIQICIGAIAQLDNFNEYDLMHTLAHETAHSIDPCTLESQSADLSFRGAQVYSSLLTCLHGGQGPDGCQNAVLNCNDEQGIRGYCQESGQPQLACFLTTSRRPSCPMGPHDPTYHWKDLSKYRNGTDPVNQIQESFADYFGAQTTGQLAKEDGENGKLRDQNKIDGLLSLATDNVRLHGTCLQNNTHDPHPVGYLRMNRNIMGSKDYREAFCGETSTPPKTKGADATCPGI
jgi:hypothetical protein